MKYDAIIIGGGLGGLTAGAKLSKEGKKILLLEQHKVPGGCATTFKRKDYLFEVGLHEMDGLHPGDMKTRIFRDLGVFDQVEFLRVPEFYRFVHKELDLVIPHDPEKAKAILIEHFPADKEGIGAYFYQLMNAREIIKNSAGREEESVGDFLDRIISSEDLKLALLGNLGYFHDDPYSMSLSYYSVAQGSYYAGGGNFIKGGSQKLSDYLAGVITRNGGEVLLKHLVTEILVEDNKATGISYKKRNSGESIQAIGDHIIANCAIPTVCDMLPGKHAENLRSAVKERKTGASLLTIYFGFNKPLKDIGSRHYSTFVFGDPIKTQRDIHRNNRSDFSERGFTLVDYSQVDSALAPEGKSVGVICCIDYSSDWESLQRSEYLAKKETVARTFISRMEKLIPGISSCLDYYEVATPKTVERYTLNPGGAVYGFAQTPERTKLGPIKSVENLYFASAWTQIGGGFSGAILNGYLSAYEILRKR
jgi:all-trans-retinol 13,14-reductase